MTYDEILETLDRLRAGLLAKGYGHEAHATVHLSSSNFKGHRIAVWLHYSASRCEMFTAVDLATAVADARSWICAASSKADDFAATIGIAPDGRVVEAA